MYDAYDRFDQRERANERAYDLNRENAAEADGITPDNVPVWMAHRIERQDGSTDTVETCNALCAAVQRLTTEHEELRESIRHEADAAGTAWGLADDFLDQRNALEAERDALQAEAAKLRDRCQVLILEKEEIRHTYQKHLGSYLRLARESMHEALEVGIVPDRLADDVNNLQAFA